MGLEPTRLATVVLETTPLTTRAPMLSKEKREKEKKKESREKKQEKKNKEKSKKKNDSGRTRTYAPRG